MLAVAAGLVELVCGALLALGWWTAWVAAGLLLFLIPVTVLMEIPLRADADFGAVIDFLKNVAILGTANGRPQGTRGRLEVALCGPVSSIGRSTRCTRSARAGGNDWILGGGGEDTLFSVWGGGKLFPLPVR